MPEPDDNAQNDDELGGGDSGTSDVESRLRAEFEARLKQELESNGAYKALQTALNKNVQRYQQELAARDAKLAALESQLSGTREGVEYLSSTVLANLPEEERDRITADLSKREVQRLSKEIQELKSARAYAQQPAAEPSFDEQQWQAILAEARESLEETAREYGLDPNEKGLDYGSDEEPFAKRLKKLNASAKAVRAAKDKADVESVKQKAPIAPTRTTGAGAAADLDPGKDYLTQGASELWDRIRTATPGSRKAK